jgi:hypothetical protein
MRGTFHWVGAAFVAASLAAIVAPQAEAGRRKPRQAAQARTQELWGISWHADIKAALAAAQGTTGTSADTQKPVFCLRVLGDLDGFM